jgi:hypothetical protein
MRRMLFPLMIVVALLTGGVSAHADEIGGGVSDGKTVGFTYAHWSAGPLTDADNHHIDHYCNFTINGVGNTVVIVLVAEATAGPHLVAVSTGIYCELVDSNNNVVCSLAQALPGTHVSYATSCGIVENRGPYTVCTIGTGQWNDTHLYTTAPKRCQAPNLPV